MHVRLGAAKYSLLKTVIQRLYERPFDSRLFTELADDACSVMDANYFSLFLLSQAERPRPTFLSNNPPGYIPIYLSVAKEDFLIRDLIANGQGCVLKRMIDYDIPENSNFIDVVQGYRPISDIMYLPLMIDGALSGYYGLARAGLDNTAFDDDQLELFRFISSFVNDAFKRSLVPPPVDDDLAYLDYKGNVVAAGPRIRQALGELLGREGARLGSSERQRRSAFIAAYHEFLYGPFKVGMDRTGAVYELGATHDPVEYSFAFSVYKPGGLFIERDGLPCAQARLLEAKPAGQTKAGRGVQRYYLTAREDEVIRGIFQCKSNRP